MNDLRDYLTCGEGLPQETARMLAGAVEVVAPEVVEKLVDQLAVRLTVDLQETNPLFVTVLHGGLTLMGMLMRRLVFPCEFGYVHVSRYGDQTEGKALSWLGSAHTEVVGRTVVLVDDIIDEGETLHALVEHFRQLGAKDVFTVVLVSRLGLSRPIEATYEGLQLEAGFLVGCGMDVAGYARNLPGIYRLTDT
ncbi:MAG: phosphoribosyltransferase family protein [Pseudomonadota bacterium]|jgi:hypoxanthine phosphoribosyltransferase|nr:phosphoribosyltransferase family protein [Pseudomonadota bacterium]